jgi:ATP-dependent DNA helicase RecQ
LSTAEKSAPGGKIYATLRDRFGLSDFRPGQREAIEAVLEGRDGLVIMPTGSGKSLIYQLSALLLPGLTVVVSPLIALMKDQTDKMEELGGGRLHHQLVAHRSRAERAGERGRGG